MGGVVGGVVVVGRRVSGSLGGSNWEAWESAGVGWEVGSACDEEDSATRESVVLKRCC